VTQSTLNPQRNYVEQILKLLSIDITLESLNQYQFLIWKNPFDPNSMQLTKHGYQIFRDKLTLEAKRFKIKPEHAKTKTYAIISKKMAGPFYFSPAYTLYAFDSRDSFMLSLMSGDLSQYLEQNSFRDN
jgi:hypothetical protein